MLDILRQFCALDGHSFWVDEVTLRDVVLPGVTITHAHLTDVYLLGLAARKGGRLATFDRHIPAAAVRNGENSLEQIPAG